MHIAIDIREACRAKRAGKGQWVFGFVTELLKRENHTMTLLTDSSVPSTWAQGATVKTIPAGWRWHIAAVRWLLRQKDIDCYVATTSYIVPFLLGGRFPCGVVVHDLIAFRSDQHAFLPRLIERLTLKRAAATATWIFCLSDATRSDLIARIPSLESRKITTISAGPQNANPLKNSASENVIISVGTLSPRKNQERLIRAYTLLPPPLRQKYSLFLMGNRGWRDSTAVSLAQATDGVEWSGYGTEQEYEQALHTCAVFALPSLYEGFGLAVLDALQRGIPVLTSDRGSLKEVVGECAVLVNPESVEDIARGLEEILSNQELRTRLRSKGPRQAAMFTWGKTVDRFLQALA